MDNVGRWGLYICMPMVWLSALTFVVLRYLLGIDGSMPFVGALETAGFVAVTASFFTMYERDILGTVLALSYIAAILFALLVLVSGGLLTIVAGFMAGALVYVAALHGESDGTPGSHAKRFVIALQFIGPALYSLGLGRRRRIFRT